MAKQNSNSKGKRPEDRFTASSIEMHGIKKAPGAKKTTKKAK